MAHDSLDLTTAVFAKTDFGRQEIQTRSLSLPPLVRRLLVLIDGKRSGTDLANFVLGQDVRDLLNQLMAFGCIDIHAHAQQTPVEDQPAEPPTQSSDELSNIPAAHTRSQKDVEMARNFMTNSVNTIFGHNTRFSLLKSIHGCQSTQELRAIYPAWAETMSGSRTGAKRLSELRQKLFEVL